MEASTQLKGKPDLLQVATNLLHSVAISNRCLLVGRSGAAAAALQHSIAVP